MAGLLRLFYLVIAVFLILSLLFNLNRRFPRFPGDAYIDKFGFTAYLPVTSTLIVAVILALVFTLLRF